MPAKKIAPTFRCSLGIAPSARLVDRTRFATCGPEAGIGAVATASSQSSKPFDHVPRPRTGSILQFAPESCVSALANIQKVIAQFRRGNRGPASATQPLVLPRLSAISAPPHKRGSGAKTARSRFRTKRAISVHIEWRIFPEYVGGGDQDMSGHGARRQCLARKQTQRERQHIVAVAVHEVGNRVEHHAAAVVGVDLLLLVFGSSPWLTMMQSLCRRFISMAFLA
jgi:hypothetical protein